MAFRSRSRGTHSATNACHVGSWMPAAQPLMKKRSTQPQGDRIPADHATPMRRVANAPQLFVARSSRRRSRVSERYPETGLRSSIGTKLANPVIPTQAADPVIRKIT